MFILDGLSSEKGIIFAILTIIFFLTLYNLCTLNLPDSVEVPYVSFVLHISSGVDEPVAISSLCH
jgi:4-amino-4-deoxy-L-arabinose transferase-like glycosyltransferase